MYLLCSGQDSVVSLLFSQIDLQIYFKLGARLMLNFKQTSPRSCSVIELSHVSARGVRLKFKQFWKLVSSLMCCSLQQ